MKNEAARATPASWSSSRADPFMNVGAAHDFALVPWDLLLSRLKGTIGGRQGPKVQA